MKKIIIGIITILYTVVPLSAQEESTGIRSGAANFLTLPTDARLAGLGGAGTALTQSYSPIFSNGALSTLQNRSLAFSYSWAPVLRDFESGHALHCVGGLYKINRRHAVLAGFRYYHYPEIGIKLSESDEMFHLQPKEWSVELGYAYQIAPRLSISTTAKLIHSDMGQLYDTKRAYACAFDLGIAYQQSFHFLERAQWSTGLQISNFGTRIKQSSTREYLPAFVKLGGSIEVDFTPNHGFLLTTDLGYRCQPSDVQAFQVNVGGEYSFHQVLKLRGGYHYGNTDKGDGSYATAGAGLCYQGIQLDFAWLFAPSSMPINNSYWLSIGYAF